MKNKRKKLTTWVLTLVMLFGMVFQIGASPRPGEHPHEFTYTAEGATITARCVPDCTDGYSDPGITVTLRAPEDLTADGSEKPATVTRDPDGDVYLLAPDTEPVYYHASEKDPAEKGEALNGVPTDPGSYVAELTWGGETVSVAYAITEPEKGEETKGGAKGGLRGPAPHEHDGITFEPWESTTSLPSEAGSWYLTDDVTISNEWTIRYDTNLCLNGHTITSTVSGNLNVISIGDNVVFNLYECQHESGAITHTTGSNGTVWVSGGHFTMYGGNITDPYSGKWGIHTGSGSFTMYGGSITGLTNREHAAVENCNNEKGTINLYGGSITGNKIGVSVGVGKVNIKGNVTINNNTDSNLYIPGDKTVTIEGELADTASIGVTLASTTGIFTSGWNEAMGNAEPSKYFTSDNTSYAVVRSGKEAAIGVPPVASVTVGETTKTYENFAAAVSEWNGAGNGATLTLLKDVTTASTVNVTGTKTLDLNGHGIIMTGSGSVISVPSGATLDLIDNDTTTTHSFTVPEGGGLATLNESGGNTTVNGGYITGGNASAGAGGGVVVDGGTFTMNGGTVIGNNANHSGGVRVSSSGMFTMNSGAITGNTADGAGAGVGAVGGTFIMAGGTISKNKLTTYSGGGVHVNTSGTFTMTGGTITGNTAKANGGGVGVISGSFTMTGGTITGNTAEGSGNGVYVSDKFLLSGNVNITGNTKSGADSNVYLTADKTVTIAGALTDGASIGVTLNNGGKGTFTSGWSANMNDNADPADYFTSDAGYDVFLVDGATEGTKEAYIGLAPHIHNAGEQDEITFQAWESTTSLPSEAGSWYLTNDVTISNEWTIRYNTNLCLNGHTITSTVSGNLNVISIGDNVVFNLYECQHESGAITHTTGSNGTVWVSGGHFTMYGGNITDPYSGKWGIHTGSGSFTMYGGSITGLTNREHAAVENCNNENGTINLYGGSITGNKIGVSVGVGKVNIKGNVTINNNTDSNLYIPGDKTVTIEGELADTASIGVTLANTTGVFTNSWDSRMGNEEPSKYFTSDNTSYAVVRSGKEAAIGVPPVASVTVGETTKTYENFAAAVSEWNGAGNGATLQLLKDVTTASTITVSGTKTLDLNGFGILMTGSGSVINVPGGATLTINDNGTTEHYITMSEYRGIAVSDTGTDDFTDGNGVIRVTGGYITGGSGNQGGAVYIAGSGVLNMNGGTLIGNKAAGGGAIFVSTSSGTSEIQNAKLIYNYASSCGGAIQLLQGNLILENCDISYNRNADADGYSAIHAGTDNTTGCTMTNCTITHNSGGAGAVQNWRNSGSGTATMELTDVSITDNTASDSKGVGGFVIKGTENNVITSFHGNCVITNNTPCNVVIIEQNVTINITDAMTNTTPIGITMKYPGTFTSGWKGAMGNARPEDYFTSDNASYDVYRSGNELVIGPEPEAYVLDSNGEEVFCGTFAAALDAWKSGGTLQLLKDVTTASTITVSGTKTLDLNGYGVKAGAVGYSVITVSGGAELTITDSDPERADGANRPDGVTGGYITGGSVGENYGGGVTVNGGTLTLTGGAISGNANTCGAIKNSGGGVYVCSGATFSMTGGEISGNTSYVAGGVGSDTSATTVSITGGVIRGNRTDRFGSAVWAGRSSGSVFRICGDAIIVDNISTWTQDKDGEGTLNTGTTYLLSGNPTVYGSWKTSGESSPNTHINLDNEGSGIQRITLEGALTNDTGTPQITVTPLYRWSDLENGQTFVFTNHWSDYMGNADPAKYFKLDDSVTAAKVVRKDGEAAFGKSGDLYVFFDANGGEGTMDSQLVTTGEAALDENAFSRDGYSFSGWNTAADGSGTSYEDGATFELTADVTLYAQWTENPPPPTEKASTPTAVFTATGADTGTLSSVAAGMTYAMDGGAAVTITGTSVDLTGLAPCTITVIQPGDGVNTLDSDAQSITVTKAETPKLTVTQPEEAGGTGSVNATAAHEYSADDGANWADCTEGQTLASGAYLIRVKAVGTALASDAQSVIITSFLPDAGGTEYVIDGRTVKTELDVSGETTPDVMVSGLDVEAAAQSAGEGAGATVTLSMSVETKSAEDAAEAGALIEIAPEESTLEFLEISVSKTVNGSTEALTETQGILEIIVPYKFKGKEYVTVYRYHNGAPEKLLKSDTKADGTYRLDKENGLIYIYTSRFSTYAIGYTQCYNLKGAIKFGSFTGKITVLLLDAQKTTIATYNSTPSGGVWNYSFTHIPKGTYYLSATWMDNGKQFSLERQISVK